MDSRGSGRSEGRLDPLSSQEIDDYAACIEWAGEQPWSNGKVGLCGKSYYAMSQWLVAARRPKHLAAICVWHGWSDWYRDATRHGGIMYQFWEKFWYPELALPVQNGAGAGTNPHSGLPVTGSRTMSADELAANRADLVEDIRTHPFDDVHYYGVRTPALGQIEVPILASADWSDHDLHLRGTIEGFLRSSSSAKWLEIHDGGQFDDPAAVTLQRRFFNYHLKGEAGDWASQPPVELAIRRPGLDPLILKTDAWPLPETSWRTLFLDAADGVLSEKAPLKSATKSYQARQDGAVFQTAPSGEEQVIAGPVAATLWISADTADADLFVILDAIDPQGRPVDLRDHRAGGTAMTVGWQRASHRAIDEVRSTPWRPWHPHRHAEPLRPFEIYEVRIELRPTSLVLPAHHRLRLTVKGIGPAHDDQIDRPAAVFNNVVTLHTGPETPAVLLLPIIPAHVYEQVSSGN